MRLLSTLLICCIISSCTILQDKHNAIMNSWKDHHRDELIKAWGIPSAEQKLTDGTGVIEYHKNRVEHDTGGIIMPLGSITYKGTTTPVYSNSGGTTKQYSCKTTFLISSSGHIYDWKYAGNDCY